MVKSFNRKEVRQKELFRLSTKGISITTFGNSFECRICEITLKGSSIRDMQRHCSSNQHRVRADFKTFFNEQ